MPVRGTAFARQHDLRLIVYCVDELKTQPHLHLAPVEFQHNLSASPTPVNAKDLSFQIFQGPATCMAIIMRK